MKTCAACKWFVKGRVYTEYSHDCTKLETKNLSRCFALPQLAERYPEAMACTMFQPKDTSEGT